MKEPIPYIGKQSLFRTCHSWIGQLSIIPDDASGVGGDSVGNYRAHVRSPGGEAGCQRHLAMANVVAVLYISPFFYFFAERQLPQKAEIEVALPKVENIIMGLHGICP